MRLADLLPLCPQTIVWEPVSSRDAFGKPTYGDPQTFRGRRVFKFSRVTAFSRGIKGEGTDAISESQVWILGTPEIGYEDLVYVQGDDTSKFLPPVLSVQRTPDSNGELFVKVFLGSANG